MKSIRALFLLLLGIWNYAAFAHPVAQGSVDIDLQPREMLVSFRVSNEQVFVASTFATAARQTNSPGTPTLENLWHDHATYLLDHVRVEVQGAILKGQLLSVKEPQDFTINGFTEYVLRFPFPSSNPKSLRITESLLGEIEFAPGNPWETTFTTRIKENGKVIDDNRVLSNKQPLEITPQWEEVATQNGRWNTAIGLFILAFVLFAVFSSILATTRPAVGHSR